MELHYCCGDAVQVERSVRPHVVPITLKQAREFVAAHHRHNKPPADLRCCANCAHWHKKEYIHCQCSGPWGGDIFGDKNCTFRARKVRSNDSLSGPQRPALELDDGTK